MVLIVALVAIADGFVDSFGSMATRSGSDLTVLQRIFAKPHQVNMYGVKLDNSDDVERVRRLIADRVRGVTVSRSAEFAENTQDIQVTRRILALRDGRIEQDEAVEATYLYEMEQVSRTRLGRLLFGERAAVLGMPESGAA